MMLTLADSNIEGTLGYLNGTFAFSNEDMHHEIATLLRVDLELDQAMIALGNHWLSH